MKRILLLLIKGYWFLMPPQKRKKCLFKKSCSHYVFDKTNEVGFLEGMKALNYRCKHCRPGYYVVQGKEGKFLISARNKVFDSAEIDESVFTEPHRFK